MKLIEEPPDDTLFILVAENQEAILTTILSRCQLVKLPPLTDEDIKTGLILRGVTQGDAEVISHLADGDFNAAMLLSKQSENDNAQLFLDWMRTCFKGNGVEMVSWVDKFATIGRERQKLFLKYGLHFLRELMVLVTTGNQHLRLQGAELDAALKMQSIINFEKIQPLSQLFNDCSLYIERNANPKILFLDTSIQVNKILRGT